MLRKLLTSIWGFIKKKNNNNNKQNKSEIPAATAEQLH